MLIWLLSVYTFSHEKGEPMPYRIKIPSKNVSLRHVKEFLPKKGAFRWVGQIDEQTKNISLIIAGFTLKLKWMAICVMKRRLKTLTWFHFGMERSWFSAASLTEHNLGYNLPSKISSVMPQPKCWSDLWYSKCLGSREKVEKMKILSVFSVTLLYNLCQCFQS